MSRQILTLQRVDASGKVLDFSNFSVDGMSVMNNGADTVVQIANDHTAAISVTIEHPGEVDGNAVADKVVSIPAADTVTVKALSLNYVQASGYVHFNAANGTDAGHLTIASFV